MSLKSNSSLAQLYLTRKHKKEITIYLLPFIPLLEAFQSSFKSFCNRFQADDAQYP